MAPLDFLPDIIADPGLNAFIWASIVYVIVIIIIALIWIITSKKKKGVDVSALAALASSDAMTEDAAPNADPKEVISILQIERVAASTALSAVKDAQKSRRISASVSDSLMNRYKARIAKIDSDIKRRSGAQEYRSLAESLEQSRDKIRDEIMPGVPSPPPPISSTPGIPPTAPPVPGMSGPQVVPPMTSPSISGIPPTKPASPIPTPPKMPTISPSTRPSTVVPPSVAPPTIAPPPLPPKPTGAPVITPPTTSNMAPPPVPTSIPVTSAPPPPATDSDAQSISGLRMEMLRELARLKKFMSEETQQ